MAVRTHTSENKTAAEVSGMLIQARNVSIPKQKNSAGVSGLSLHVRPGELVALVGPRPDNQALLIEGLLGRIPPAEGEILFNGVNRVLHQKVLRGYIGVVPADPALPEDLTPGEILLQEANLRYAGGDRTQTPRQRVLQVLEMTGLDNAADRSFSAMGGEERQRVSLAVELLGQPEVLLIEPPLHPLISSQEVRFTLLLKSLAKQGFTIIQAVNSLKCAMLADQIIILGGDGSMAWFGPPDEAIEYLRGFHPKGSELNSSFSLDHSLEALEAGPPNAKNWGELFKSQPAFKTYVVDPLSGKRADLGLEERPLTRFRGATEDHLPPPKRAQPAALRKFATLVRREFAMLLHDRSAWLLLVVPVLFALIDFLLSSPTMLAPLQGDPSRLPTALGLLVFFNMLTAALLVQPGVLKEKPVFLRDSRAAGMIGPYLASKLLFLALFAIYQGVVWAVIHYLVSGMAGGVSGLAGSALTFVLVAWIGGIIGVIASFLSGSALAAGAIALLFLLPQLIFGGSIVPISHLSSWAKPITAANPSMYAFGSLLTLSGYGQDVAADACWQLPRDQRSTLTDAQKLACPCMGDNVFSKCRFPGIYQTFHFAIEQAPPVMPTPDPILNSPPVQPLLTPGETLETYAGAVNQYTLALETYLTIDTLYTNSLRKFSTDLAAWQGQRSQAVAGAEQMIALAVDHYGSMFQVPLVAYWLAMAAISLVFIFVLTVILIRKGV